MSFYVARIATTHIHIIALLNVVGCETIILLAHD
jgi:hypothetical protein